ncbi:ABC transporter substrate-binding protein [Paenibacillus hodogayensis]|uniref:ABC transporter substrate-binding protein n=1 Tax=Paenibacillus hodogayensis TaxID=279208 RepID=A0ABV5W6X6_9BACL
MIRKITTAGVVALTMLTSAACGSANQEKGGSENSSGQPTKITFYSYNLAIASQKEGVLQLISEFEAAHPTIKIDPIAIAANEVNTKVQADIAAGSRPDVAQLVFDGLDYAVQNYGAKALEDVVPADELKKNFEGFSPNGLKLGQLKGKTYGMPYTFSTPVLFYNAKIFQDAGLDPSQPPKTWDEVKQAALQITSKTNAAGVHIQGMTGADWVAQALVGSNGGKVLSDDRKSIQFGEPAAVGAITMWRDLIQSGAHDKLNDGDVTQSFSEGKLGMLLTTSALQSGFIAAAKAGGWELKNAAMPSFGSKPTTPVNSGSALFILSDDQAKQKAAWEFVKFVTSERGYTIITTKMGYLPLRPAIVDDPQYLKDWVAQNPLVKPNLEQLTRLQPWVSYPGSKFSQVESTFLDAVQKSLQTTGDITSIMQDAQKRAQTLIQ